MIKETIKETEKLSQECDSFFQYREKGWEKLFCIEEELKKLPGKPGVYIYWKGNQFKKSCSAVFSKQSKSGDKERTDGGTDCKI